MNKPTIASVVKEVTKNKPINVRRMAQDINRQYPDLCITEKKLNEFLYNEYYDNTLYGSCERFERKIL